MKSIIAAIAALVLFSSSSCSGSKSLENVFRYKIETEPQTLDPSIIIGLNEMRVAMQIFEGLCAYHPKNLAPLPGVAESWSVSPDGLTWTFKLRTNSRWSDGAPVNAETFRWSWLRTLSPEIASGYAYILWCIRGAEAYTSQKGKAEDVGIKVVSPFVLEVNLAYPVSYFPSLVCHISFSPVPRHSIEKYGNSDWIKAGNLVGNGPFTLTEWKPRDRLVLRPNSNYWDASKIHLKEAVINPLEDTATGLEMYLNGELDNIDNIPIERIDEMSKRKDFYNSLFLATDFYTFNVKTPSPLTNILVRKALSMSIDRKQVCKFIQKHGPQPSLGIVPPLFPGYPSDNLIREDVAEARRLLAKAGYPEGKGFPRLIVLTDNLPINRKKAEAYQQMWKKNLGIDVVLENQEWKVFIQKLSSRNYQLAQIGWIADYQDPMTFLDIWTTGSGNNFPGWSDPKFDLTLAQALKETDPKKRYRFMREAEKIFIDACAIMPVLTGAYGYLISPRVKGFYNNVLDLHPFKEINVEARK